MSDHLRHAAPPPGPPAQVPASPDFERLPWLCLLPILATGLYYLLPTDWQALRTMQFLPQGSAYLAFGIWLACNDNPVARLGLCSQLRTEGVLWGFRIGLALGVINASIILWVVPWLGRDILFLRETPHAQIPVLIMVPWVICAIALFVELNFRGFLLGRLLTFFIQLSPYASRLTPYVLAVGLSALVFSFDPFMVVTFRHLHWIAVWDGLVWGLLWVQLRNLYAPIVAHAVEVMVMYSIIKTALS